MYTCTEEPTAHEYTPSMTGASLSNPQHSMSDFVSAHRTELCSTPTRAKLGGMHSGNGNFKNGIDTRAQRVGHGTGRQVQCVCPGLSRPWHPAPEHDRHTSQLSPPPRRHRGIGPRSEKVR